MKITEKLVYVIFLNLIAISIIIGLRLALEFQTVPPDRQLSNNITLIVEIAVGIIITLIVLMLTKINEIKIDEKITSVLDIVKEREKNRKVKEWK